MKWLVLIAGIAVASVVLAFLAFAPVPVPPAPPGFVVVCGAPTPPQGYMVVCYEKVAPSAEDVLKLGLILTIVTSAVIAFGHVINDVVRRADAAGGVAPA
jgi:hypothetical protein